MQGVNIYWIGCFGTRSYGGGENGYDLSKWEQITMQKVDSRIDYLKSKITPRKTNPVLKRDDFKKCLDRLHKHFVLVPVDKAC